MTDKVQGVIVCAEFEKADVFNWTDPSNNQVKPIRSLKVLLPHGDGTVTRESLSLPPNTDFPNLIEGEVYAFPCVAGINKKRQEVSWMLRTDLSPFPAPELG